MSYSLIKRASARRDLDRIFDYFEEAAGLNTAERFTQSAERAMAKIVATPFLGSLWHSPDIQVRDIRTWSIPRFRKYLIFYKIVGDTIEILRVLHGARDVGTILDDDDDLMPNT